MHPRRCAGPPCAWQPREPGDALRHPDMVAPGNIASGFHAVPQHRRSPPLMAGGWPTGATRAATACFPSRRRLLACRPGIRQEWQRGRQIDFQFIGVPPMICRRGRGWCSNTCAKTVSAPPARTDPDWHRRRTARFQCPRGRHGKPADGAQQYIARLALPRRSAGRKEGADRLRRSAPPPNGSRGSMLWISVLLSQSVIRHKSDSRASV